MCRRSVHPWAVIGTALLVLAGGIALGIGDTRQGAPKAVAAKVSDRRYFGVVAFGGSTTLISGSDIVYVYTPTGRQADLVAADGQYGVHFGGSLALAGDTALVGAPGKNSFEGAVYVFTRSNSTWTQQAELSVAETGTPTHYPEELGWSVALAGDTAVLGSRGSDAYVFARADSVWTQQATLPTANYGFTVQQVAVSGDTAAVGVNYDKPWGEVYVFTRSGTSWTRQAVLEVPDSTEFDAFGGPVALDGETLAVGAYGTASGRGAAYVFARTGTTWTQQATLTGPDALGGDGFGSSLALAGETVLVGAYDTNSGHGAAYVFARSGTNWAQRAKLISPNRLDQEFGSSVALSGDAALATGFEWVNGLMQWYSLTLSAGVAGPPGSCLPRSVRARTDAAHPERSTLHASGTIDNGSSAPDFSGAATFDVGGFHLSVPAFVPKGKSLRYSADGITLTVRPAINGSSRAAFSVNVVGDLTGRVDLDAPLALRFTNAANDLSGAVNLKSGRLAAHGVASPDLSVVAASADFRGGGRDSLRATLAFAADEPPTTDPMRLTIGFGNTYAEVLPFPVLRGRRSYVFMDWSSGYPRHPRAVVNYARGTITIAGRGLDLGSLPAGGVTSVTVTLNGKVYSTQVRMARIGTKLTY